MRALRAVLALAGLCISAAALGAESFEAAPFGTVSVLKGQSPHDLVLFLSGDGGWNLGVISMAQRLADQGALVAGIDIRRYLAQLEQSSDACVTPAKDLASLGELMRQKFDLGAGVKPTLVGYSSGATLVYAALVEGAPGSFTGALSLGFCPDLDLKKPLCKGAGVASTPRLNDKGVLKGVNFLPAKALPGPWISLQGQLDQVCPLAPTASFMAQVPKAELVKLPKVGHGYSVEKNWVPQFENAYRRIAASP